MDYLSHTARVDMSKKVLNDLIFISDHVGHDLLLLSVDEELDDLAKVAGEDWVHRLIVIFGVEEFEKAIKEHILANLLIL